MVNSISMDFCASNVKQRVEQFLDTPANRDLVDVLRVRYWYEGVKQQMNCSTAYQLERLFEPLEAPSVDARTPFRNKWIRYEAGKNTPRPNLVDLVEKRAHGASKELNHPLWEVLRLGERVGRLDAWIEKLDPRVQTALYRKSQDSLAAPNWQSVFSMSLGRRLVKLGNIDALTALLLLWLDAQRSDRFEDMRQLAGLLYQLLLMLGMEFDRRNMAEEVFLMFRATVFDCTDWEAGYFAVDETLYMRGVHLLYCQLHKVQDLNPFTSWFARCKAMQTLLSGKRGLDVPFGLQILLLPDWREDPPTTKQWELWRNHYMHWLWGWTHLNRNTTARILNDTLWDELEAAFATLDSTKNLIKQKSNLLGLIEHQDIRQFISEYFAVT